MSILKALARIPPLLWFLIAGGAGYWQYLQWKTDVYEPLTQQVQAKKSDLEQKKAEVKKAIEFKSQRDQKLRELQDLGQTLEATKTEMPFNSGIPDLLQALADASDQTGLQLPKFRPETPRRIKFLVETPIAVTLKGTYLQIMSFLDATANLKRFVSTEKLTMDTPVSRGSVSILTATATLVTYHIDPSLMSIEAKGPTAPNPGAAPAATSVGAPAAPEAPKK